MCYVSAHVVPKKIFPLGLAKQVKIICVNYGGKVKLLGSNTIWIAVNTAFERMKGKKYSLPNKDINKYLKRNMFLNPGSGSFSNVNEAARSHLNPTET